MRYGRAVIGLMAASLAEACARIYLAWTAWRHDRPASRARDGPH